MLGPSPAILWALLLAGLLCALPAAACKGEASPPPSEPALAPAVATPALTPTPPLTHQSAPTATPTLNQLAAGFRYSAVSADYQTCLLRTDGVAVCWGGGSTPPRGRYSAISVGAYACGVREDGEARCWGDRRYNNHYGQMDAPEGEFQAVSVGVEHACGIRTDGRVECWGKNTDVPGNVLGQSGPPEGVFRSVSAGNDFTCGIRQDYAAQCWGDYRFGATKPPAGDFQSVSAGERHACGLHTDGTAACWGANREGQATPPSGVFSAISAGGEHTCALRPDGSAVCWGLNNYGQASPPEGAFAAIDAGRLHTCALRPDGSPRCWGDDESGTATPPGLPVEPVYTCASGAEGGLQCRRDDPYDPSADGQSAAPAGDFSAVSAAPYRVCALRSGGTVACLNPDLFWVQKLALPGGGYVAVSAATTYVCGLRANSKLFCASDRDTESAVLIPGSFRAVSVGEGYACAVTTEGAARCWDTWRVLKTHEHIPPTTPPPYDDFTGVSVGQWHACGVRSGGQVACWGDNYGYYEYCTSCDLTAAQPCTPTCGLTGRTDYIGQAAPPGGRFRSVSAGYMHTCGIRADDGGVECWGESDAGRLTPPPGAYAAVSAGRWHTCGIRRGGRGVCWGHSGVINDDYALPVAASDCLTPAEGDGPCHSRYYRTIRTQPPAGEFVAVAAGRGFSCGARGDGALKCWGRVPGVISVER